MTLVLAGFIAGFVHVLSGPDHLAAIAPYAAHQKRDAWRTGIRWGVGHAAGAIAIGLLVLLFREAVPVDAVSAWSERLIGLVLIGIGALGLRAAWVQARGQAADAVHDGIHQHAPLGVGALHGLAGSAHLFGLLPALALPWHLAALYLLLFGIGTVVAMAAFASLVGWVAGRVGIRSQVAQSMLSALLGVAAIVVGGMWALGAA